MLRRLHPDQPDSFAFTAANQAWAEAQITKFPEGRQASAIIPLLWRAQEQEGWLSRAAIEHVAEMLGMAYIRALEVATFYFMFQLQPVGSVANIQICGTTSCMIMGSEDLVGVCKAKIAARAHELSDDGKFSWEEVECLGACANAPMAQIGKDYYEDLTPERLGEIIDELSAGKVPTPGPQTGRYASEPASGLTSLAAHEAGRAPVNASVALAMDLGDTVKRIDGSEAPLRTPWQQTASQAADAPAAPAAVAPEPEARAEAAPAAPETPAAVAPAAPAAPETPAEVAPEPEAKSEQAPAATAPSAAHTGPVDDLKRIKGVGPGLEKKLHEAGVTRFAQIAAWGPEDVVAMDDKLSFKGRIDRDGWIEQARQLAGTGDAGTD